MTDAGQQRQTLNSEFRATQPMEAQISQMSGCLMFVEECRLSHLLQLLLLKSFKISKETKPESTSRVEMIEMESKRARAPDMR